MNPAAKAAADLAAQMRLDGPKKGRSSQLEFATTEARVIHENSTPESRAQAAIEKTTRADADIASKAKMTQARTFAHEAFIHGQALPDALAGARRCLTVDEFPLRALLRQIWDAGFTAGYNASQKAD